MDMTNQIANSVRQIDRLRVEQSELWAKAAKFVADGQVDHALSLLNRYFSKKEELEGSEQSLASQLKSYFQDR